MKLYNVEVYKAYSLQQYYIFANYESAMEMYDELVKEKEQDEYQNWWVYLEITHGNEDNTEVLVWEVVNTYCKNKVSHSHPDEENEELTNE